MRVCVCACPVTQSCPTLCGSWIAACQDPLSMGFPRQEYWSELPCPAPGDLPDPGVNVSVLHWQAGYLLLSHLGSPSARCGSSRRLCSRGLFPLKTLHSAAECDSCQLGARGVLIGLAQLCCRWLQIVVLGSASLHSTPLCHLESQCSGQ